MDRFEAWLREQGIRIVQQVATGSGDMVRYRLRLLDGAELDVPLSAETLLERPEAAIRLVEAMIVRHDQEQRRGNGRG